MTIGDKVMTLRIPLCHIDLALALFYRECKNGMLWYTRIEQKYTANTKNSFSSIPS